jgi:hypothetical protein
MAKKIEADLRKDGLKSEVYPWLRLLELEVQPMERPAPKRGKGRPPNPFPRKPVHVTLTEDELAALDEVAGILSERLGGRLHRGHVIAFLVFYLRSRLDHGQGIGLPLRVNSLTDLAKYLDQMEG